MGTADSSNGEQGNITRLLTQWREGDPDSLEKLMEQLHSELHLIAKNQFFKEAQNHTLQATALISELYLRLADGVNVDWRDRAHFFAVSARIIKRILIDYARKRIASGSGQKVSLTIAESLLPGLSDAVELIDFERCLEELKELDDSQYQVVVLRFYGGLTLEEVGEVTGTTKRTAQRKWTAARLWLLARIKGLA